MESDKPEGLKRRLATYNLVAPELKHKSFHMDLKQFASAIKQIAEEKGIPEDKIVEVIEAAIAAAYKRDYGEKSQIVRSKMHDGGERFSFTQVKYVVEGVDEEGFITGEVPGLNIPEDRDVKRGERPSVERATEWERGSTKAQQSVRGGTDHSSANAEEEEVKIKFNPEKYITLEEAKKSNKKAKVGDEVITELENKNEFGRIAAQTAKQVIIQRLREIERNIIFEEFKKKEGEVISGVIQRREGQTVFIDLGRTNAILPASEQLPQDGYRLNQRLKFAILRVEETPRGPVIVLSRATQDLVSKLFEFEVPEIEAGTVQILGVAREPGSRTKIAVESNQQGIDPIGSLVGQKGVRVQTVINELSGEKIDIIKWDEDPVKLIANALSPAKILDVKILNADRKHALAEVADDQFSLAIGKRGQNVRLAAKLTGWKIDVRSPKVTVSAEEAEKDIDVTEDGEVIKNETPAETSEQTEATAPEAAEKTEKVQE